MYDGDLTTNDMAEILENNDNVNQLPTTEQDEIHVQSDGQFGRHYNKQFDPNQLGRQGGQILNDPVNDRNQPDMSNGQPHFDVIEQDSSTGNIYHNRVFDPEL